MYKEPSNLNTEKKNQKMGKIQKKTFYWREYDDGKHMNICSTSLVIREMRSKNTVLYECIPIRKTKSKNSDYTKYY